MGTLVKLEGNEGLKIGTIAASNPGGGALVRIAGDSEPYPTSPKPQQLYPVSHNPLLDVLPAPGTNVSISDNFSLAKNPPLAGLPVPTGTVQASVKNGFALTPPSEESIQKWKDEKEERRKEAEKNNVYGNFQSTGGRQFSGAGTSIPNGQKEKSFGRKALDFFGGLGEAFQLGGQQTLSAIDQADYWLGVKLGLIDPKDEYTKQQAFALQNDIAEGMGELTEGKPKWQQMLTEGFQSAGNIFGSTMNLYATGLPNVAGQAVAPAAAKLAGAEAGLGATAAQKAAAGATRFAGNMLGSAAANMSGTNAAISAQSGVNKYSEAKNAGASDGDAFAAAMGAAAVEYFSNKLFSGTPLEDSPEEKGYVVELIEDAAKKLGKSDALARVLGSTPGKIGSAVFDKVGEGLEEVITGVFDPLIDRLSFDRERDLATAGELLDEFIGGVVMSVIVGAPGTVGKGIGMIQESAAYRQIGSEEKDTLNDLINIGWASGGDARKISERIAEKLDAGETVSEAEIGRMWVAIVYQAKKATGEKTSNAEIARQYIEKVREIENASKKLEEDFARRFPHLAESARGAEKAAANKNTAPDGTAETAANNAQSTAGNALLAQAVEQYRQNGRVSNSTAEKILNDPETLNTLAQDDAILTNGMTASEQRAAIRYAVERLAKGAESTAVNDSPVEHTAAEQRVIEDYKNAVDADLVAFYESAKNETVAKKGAAPYMLKPANDTLAADIQRETGVNVSGFDTRLDVRQANHIYKDHGENGKSDHTMADANDVGRIQYVLDNYDDIRAWGNTDAYWEADRNGKNRRAKTVLISKKVNGTYYVVEAVPVTNAKSIYVVSAYMLESGKTPPGNAQKIKAEENQQPNDTNFSSRRYGQTATVENSSVESTVAQNENAVKGELERAEAKLAEAERAYSELEERFLYAESAEEAQRLMPETEAAFDRLSALRERVEAMRRASTAQGTTNTQQGAENAQQSSTNTQQTAADDGRVHGLVMDQYWRRAYLPSSTSRALDVLGEALGVEIRFAEQIENGASNAMYQDGVITIALDAKTPVITAAVHEAVHAVRKASPEAYAALERFVRDAMSEGQLQFNLEVKRRLYGEQGEDYLTEEVVADAFGRMMDDNALLRRFAQDNRSAAQKFKDALRDIINALRRFLLHQNKKLSTLERETVSDLADRAIAMESLLESAIREAGEQGVTMDGEVRYSLKEDSEGRELSEAQQEYFKDSKAVDEEGRLLNIDGFYLNVEKKPGNLEPTEKNMEAYNAGVHFRETYGENTEAAWTRFFFDEPELAEKTMFYNSVNERYFNAGMRGELPQYRLAIRFGKIPENGRSKNWGTGELERGVSVVNFLNSKTQNEKTLYDYVYGMQGTEKTIVGGWDFGIYGTDGEPLLINPVTIAPASEINRIKLADNQNPTSDPDIRYSRKETAQNVTTSEREILNELVKKYGAIPRGERTSREVNLPKQTDDDTRVSQTVRTVMEAKATPDEALPSIEKLAAKGKFSYEVYSDKQAISDAAAQIEDVGWSSALEKWTKAVKSGNVSKANTAMGWALYNNAVNKGDTDLAIDVLEKMVEHQRSAAQAVQATRILKQMSPETQLYGVQRSVANLQAELNDRYAGKKRNAPELKIDPSLAEQLVKAKDQTARDSALRDIYRDIGRQMPSRFRDRWNAWRYLAMLGNARTHGRNVVGNLGFVLPVAIKDAAATGIEAAVYRLSGGRMERSKAFGKDFGKLAKAAWSDYAKVQETALGGGKYSDMQNANKYVEEGRKIFGNLQTNSPYAAVRTAARTWNNTVGKALESFRKFNGKALDAEDVWFSKPHYAFAMAQFCKANGITAEQIRNGERLEAARDYAILEAQKATYRDTNEFSQMVSQLGRSGTESKNRFVRGASTVMEGILPFRKTPANILARGVEYSPIGLLNGIYKATAGVAKGKYTAAQAIDSISAGLTGSGLMAFGMFLAAQGLVRGRGGDDDEKRKFEEMQGHQSYSLELPDGTSVTLDWLAPEALPFFVGVNLWEATHEKKAGEDGKSALTLSEMLNAVSNVSEPMLEMSCLQSLNDVFDAVGYAADEDVSALVSALASAATSYVTQALPTLLGQAERTGESKRYTTYTEKNSFLTGDMQYALGKASARTPGWDFQQIPYIDAWGREENSGELPERAFNNFLNPSYTSKIETSEMEKELLRLYEETGEATVLPDRAPKYLSVLGERVYLSAEDYVQIARARGELSYELVNDLVASDEYKKMGDPDKAGAVKGAYDAAKLEAVRQVFGAEYAMKTCGVQAYEKAQKAVENGSTWEAYYSIYTGNRGVVEDWRKYLNAAMQPFGETARLGALAAMMKDTTYEKLEAAVAEGISVYNYVSFRYDIKDLEGDKDKDGNPISGSLKEKVVEVIDGLNLTSEQKDFLYLQQNYAESTLGDTPWHKRK